jgi:1-acyl-sn-glycerol-3-phosphate acyltransferase
VKILEKGRALVLFPEGTRSRDGRLQPLKRGICLIGKRTGAPVVPVLVRGAHALWPRSRKLPIPGQMQVVFGNPIHWNTLESESSDAFMARLAAAYRDLVRETGASELEPVEASSTEAGAAVASASTNHEEHPVPLEAAAGV